MKHIFKIAMIMVLALVVLAGGWFLYLTYGPQLSMEEILPSKLLVYAQLKDPLRHWDSLEKSDLYQNLAGIDINAILKHNKVPPQKADEFIKGYQQAMALMKNPVVRKLLGKEIALAQYPSKDPKAGLVLVTRSLASIQVAANLSLFLKDLGNDIIVSKDYVNGQVVVHLAFKQKDLSFKYTHVRNLLVFTDESSPLINEVIATVRHQRPSIKQDDQFKELSAHFYPNAQGSFYLDIKGMLLDADAAWANPLIKYAGFKAYGISFLPGQVDKYKFLLTYDQEKIDPALKKMLACAPVQNDSLGLIPPSAIAYHWGGCYEFKEIAAQLKAGADAALQDQPKRIRKSIQKKLSGNEFAELVDLLGQEAGGYVTDVDTQGIFPYPRMLLFVKVTDPLKVKALLDGIIAAKNGFSFIAREAYNGDDIHYVSLPLGGNMDPGFVLKGDYFLVASSRQLLKKSIDTYSDPSRSFVNDKQFNALELRNGTKPSAIIYIKVKEVANRGLGILEWYGRYLSKQVELAGAYNKEAEGKKRELALDVINQEEELRLARQKLTEWQTGAKEHLLPEEMANDAAIIKNFEEQIKQIQQTVKDDQDQAQEIDRVVAKNTIQAAQYRSIMYNTTHVLVPVFKGLGSINAQGIRFASSAGTMEVECILD